MAYQGMLIILHSLQMMVKGPILQCKEPLNMHKFLQKIFLISMLMQQALPRATKQKLLQSKDYLAHKVQFPSWHSRSSTEICHNDASSPHDSWLIFWRVPICSREELLYKESFYSRQWVDVNLIACCRKRAWVTTRASFFWRQLWKVDLSSIERGTWRLKGNT